MKKRILICDRCGKELNDNDDIKYIINHNCDFEMCSDCYKIMKPIKEKKDKECEILENKIHELNQEFYNNFTAFINGDES